MVVLANLASLNLRLWECERKTYMSYYYGVSYAGWPRMQVMSMLGMNARGSHARQGGIFLDVNPQFMQVKLHHFSRG